MPDIPSILKELREFPDAYRLLKFVAELQSVPPAETWYPHYAATTPDEAQIARMTTGVVIDELKPMMTELGNVRFNSALRLLQSRGLVKANSRTAGENSIYVFFAVTELGQDVLARCEVGGLATPNSQLAGSTGADFRERMRYMNDAEYIAFLEYLFHTYIRDRLHGIERYWDYPEGKRRYMWRYAMDRLRRDMHLIRYIQSHCDDADDIYSTFQADRLTRVVDEVRDGVLQSHHLAEETGFLDAIEGHYPEIVAGMKLDHFPEAELVLLRDFGSDDPKRDIQAVIHILKAREHRRSSEITSIRTQLSRGEEQLSSAIAEMRAGKEEREPSKKPRRWFKGLGQVAQGAALSLADIGLAVGVLQFPVSLETQTWGSVISTTTGVGMIMTGLGELRAE